MNWYPSKLTAHINTYVFDGRLINERLGKGHLPDGIVAVTQQFSFSVDRKCKLR